MIAGDVTFAEDRGTLAAPEEAMRALLEEGDHAAIQGTGAIVDGAPHPALAASLHAVREATCTLRLERGERVGAGWATPGAAAVLVPRPDGRLQLSGFAPLFLPDALARMNDVGPRPRISPAVTIPLAPGALATALATRSLGALATELDAGPAGALDATLRGLREHWRVLARWTPGPGSAGVRVVEVVDSDAGMWAVVPDGPTVELWPITPTHVFRMLAGLLPREHELP